ncbi:MAG: diguanylate cyclase [Deltaproteobacteria bacterium]|nr:diguanylate cyclase [Deltaproteobacteria bacterium]
MTRLKKENHYRLSDKTMQIDRSTIAEQMQRATSSSRKASFIILGGLDVGSVVKIEGMEATLGRDPNAEIVLRDDGISRHHAEVTRVGDTLVIRDLNSTNGTFVDGKKINQATISDGGKVLLGRRTVLKFVLQDEIEETFQRQLYESSTRDGLTGAYNRKYFIDKIVTDISFATRHKLPFTLLLLDIDFFKKVNDTYGHRTGDKVLIAVTDVISATIRTEDVLARYGGEEFAVIAQGTDLEGGGALAERIRKRIADTPVTAAEDSSTIVKVTASIGVATSKPGLASQPDAMVSAADKNLYEAKETGRNKVVASLME